MRENSEVQRNIGLSAKQIAVERGYSTRRSAFVHEADQVQAQEMNANAVLEEIYAKVLEIVGIEKLPLVARFMANSEFEADG